MAYSITRTDGIGGMSYYREFGTSAGASQAVRTSLSVPYARSGTRVPGYRWKIANGHDAGSPYSISATEWESVSPLSVQCSNNQAYPNDRVGLLEGTAYLVPWYAPTLASFDSTVDDNALRDLYDSVGDALGSIQALPFIGEFAQTKRMVGSRLRDLVRSVSGAKRALESHYYRRRRSGASWRSVSNELGSKYLEYKFGWSPLMHDISAAFEEIRSGCTHGVFEVSGYASRTSQIASSVSEQGHGVCRWQYSYAEPRRYTVKYKGAIRVSTTIPQRWGLSPSDIPGAVWELTPWSWFIDYFFDIGNWLRSFQYATLPVVYLSKSSSYNTDMEVCISAIPDNSVRKTHFARGVGILRRVSYTRSPLSSIPFFVPQLHLAGPMEGLRELNIAAVLAQRIRPY